MSYGLLALGALVALAAARSSSPAAPTVAPKPGPTPRPSPKTPPDPVVPRAPSSGEILLVGDSLAVGLGPPLSARFANLHTLGLNGTTIAQWVAGVAAAPGFASRPRLVLFCLGTNDIAGHANAEATRPQIVKLIETARAQGAKVGWIAPPSLPWPGFGLRAVLAQEAARLRVPLFDTAEVFTFALGERASDGVHATPAGYAHWADAIAAWLPGAGLA